METIRASDPVRPLRLHRSRQPRLRAIAASLLAAGLASPLALAAPQDGQVVAGQAHILTGKDNVTGGHLTYIDQKSERAAIDWRSFSIDRGERVHFNQPNVTSSTLNRVTGDQVSAIRGTLSAKGQVILVNPNGIVFGKDARVDVGGLIASTSNISNANFLEGKLIFDAPGKPGAGIIQSGTITAAEGGLVALVAPHVRNDGLIQAKLGKVVLGSGDTFTIDLFGDQLVSLALSDAHAGRLVDAEGKPVTALINQAGDIDVQGGKAVLMTVGTAKAVVDDVINMSGVVRADTAQAQHGSILLLGRGGAVEVGGELAAAGASAGTRGGAIEVAGERVKLTETSLVDTSGQTGGGRVDIANLEAVGSPSAPEIAIENGARLNASGTLSGNGGVIDIRTPGSARFAGTAWLRGGAEQGDGGRMRIAAAGPLALSGAADATAPTGQAGVVDISGAIPTIGPSEGNALSRTLRTGTSVNLQSATTLDVVTAVDGRGTMSGGGLSLKSAGDLNLRNDIFTESGAVRLDAAGSVFAIDSTARLDANGRTTPLVFAGNAPLAVDAAGTISLFELITGGAASVISTGGSILLGSRLGFALDRPLGSLVVRANSTDPNSLGEVAMADVRVAGGGSVDVEAFGNVRMFFDTAGASGLAAADAASPGSVRVRSGLFGDLWNNPEFRAFPTLSYTSPGGDEDWTTLSDNDVDFAPPALIPPSPTARVAQPVALAAIDPVPASGQLEAPPASLPPAALALAPAAVAPSVTARPAAQPPVLPASTSAPASPPAAPASPALPAPPPVSQPSVSTQPTVEPSIVLVPATASEANANGPIIATSPAPAGDSQGNGTTVFESTASAPASNGGTRLTMPSGSVSAEDARPQARDVGARVLNETESTGMNMASEDVAAAEGGLPSGGRGVAADADLGRGRALSGEQDVFAQSNHVVQGSACNAGGGVNAYFASDAFGTTVDAGCSE